MNPQVIAVEPQTDHKVLLTFDNKEIRVFDMSPYISLNPQSFLSSVSLGELKGLRMAFKPILHIYILLGIILLCNGQ